MDFLQQPRNIDGRDFDIDGRYNLKDNKSLFNVSWDWNSIQEWIIWIMWLEIYLAVFVMAMITLYAIYVRYANRSSVVRCDVSVNLDKQTVLITAISAGMGFEAARLLAEMGARVILACTDIKEAHQISDAVKTKDGNGVVIVKKLDISSLRSVQDFADDFLRREKRLDVLMLTANIGGTYAKNVTEDDLELTMATNHFGHFLLVNHLLGLLKSSVPSRVVIVASSAHYLLSSINSKDLNFDTIEYGGLRAYAQSMACNLLMTSYLAHLTEHGGVVVNAMCGGMMSSQPFLQGGGIISRIYRALLSIASRSNDDGAQTLVYLATSEEGAKCTGSFFADCMERGLTPLGKNHGLAKNMWEQCESIVGLGTDKKD